MVRSAFLLVLALLALLLALPQDADSQTAKTTGPLGPIGSAATGDLLSEPVLLFTVSGSTLTGPVFQQLSVYDSGLATFASQAAYLGGDATIETATVSESELQALRAQLWASQAHQLQDQNMTVTDVPLTTMTVFRGGTEAHAHSYSYWLGIAGYQAPADVVQSFIDTHFPGL